MDEELKRIASIMKKLTEVNDAMWMLQKRCGSDARKRAAQYLMSRKPYIIKEFTENI